MNKWQKYYIENCCEKRLTKSDKDNLKLLERVGDTITVHFPKFESRIASQCHEAYTKTFILKGGVEETMTLISNLKLWTCNGYVIER